MAKKFSKNNPLDNLSGIKTSRHENTNLMPTEAQHGKAKKGQEYLRLDITGYKDYISLMAEHEKNSTGKYVSMTQYIIKLIEADKQKNIDLYTKLAQIEEMKHGLI